MARTKVVSALAMHKDELFKLWRQGFSISELSRKFNVTRGMVAGYLQRNDELQTGRDKYVLHQFGKSKSQSRANSKDFVAQVNQEVIVPVTTTVPEPASKRVAFLDLEKGMCKFMDDDLLACGHETVNGNYCQHHFERCVTGHWRIK